MKLNIEIDCDNAAFDEDNCGTEIARILHAFAGRVESYSTDDMREVNAPLFDINGNKVGRAHTM